MRVFCWKQGYLDKVYFVDDGKQGMLRLYIRYDREGKPVIHGLQRVSKPGLRKFAGCQDMERVLNGLGVAIVTTSRGVMTDHECRREGVWRRDPLSSLVGVVSCHESVKGPSKSLRA